MNRSGLTTLLIFIWAILFTHLVRAATMADFMGPYDPDLTMWAAGFSALGGLLRTIISLQSDKRAVMDKFKEGGWDLFKGLISGMFAFFVIQAIRSYGHIVPNEVRFGAVVAAGWAGLSFVYWARDLFTSWVASKVPSIYVNGSKPKDPS